MARLAVGSRTKPDNPLVKFACPYCKHSSFATISAVNKHIGKRHKGQTMIKPKRFIPVY